MWVILIIRYDKGVKRVIPLLKSDDDCDEMAIYSSERKAQEVCMTHLLAKSSECIMVNINTCECENL